MSTIPVIDIAPLLAGTDETGVAQKIGAACREVGFFYITGHGVPQELVDRVFATSAAFFAAPEALKLASLFSASGNRGYIPLGGETLEPGKPADVKEAFNIGLELPADDPELLARAPFRSVNVWPDVPGFRDTMLDYFNRLWRLGCDLHHAFALDLGLPKTYFEDKLDKPIATLRLLRYPRVEGPLEDGQLGAGEHTDYGNVTLLATDAVGGLMARDRSGRWLDAPAIPGAFVCNIGDCLMRWSNDIYVSTPHKVVSPSRAERYSLAFFLDPNPDALVECLPTCTSADMPAKYPPVTGGDFLRSRLEPTYTRLEEAAEATAGG
jgi:isopenicillin N synthase-like dioxygenase